MRLAICDRVAEDRRTLMRLLETAFAKRSIACTSEQYAQSEELLCDIKDGVCYDTVILALEIGDVSGLETARKLRESGFDGEIVFGSDSASFAVDGYEVGACGYLLKPYRAERLNSLVQKMSMRARVQCLTVCHYRAVIRIPYHDILFIESRNTKCVIHRHTGEEIHVYRRLDELEEELNDTRFLRCHQSYLVNMDRIVEVDDRFVVEGGKTVAIRQRELKRIRDKYLRYLSGEM